MNTMDVILISVAAIGWLAFAIIAHIANKISDGWKEVNRLQEERHAKEVQCNTIMGQQIQFMQQMNRKLAEELHKRGGHQPETGDDPDWWKKQ